MNCNTIFLSHLIATKQENSGSRFPLNHPVLVSSYWNSVLGCCATLCCPPKQEIKVELHTVRSASSSLLSTELPDGIEAAIAGAKSKRITIPLRCFSWGHRSVMDEPKKATQLASFSRRHITNHGLQRRYRDLCFCGFSLHLALAIALDRGHDVL